MPEFVQIVHYSGAVQGLLFSIGLLLMDKNRIANRLLASLTLIIGAVLLAFALQADGLYRKYPHLLLVFDQLILLIFPLYFLFSNYLLTNSRKFGVKELWHFLPFILSVLAHIPFFSQSAKEKIFLVQNPSNYYAILEIVTNETVTFQSIFYCLAILLILKKYKAAHKHEFAGILKRRVYIIQFGTLLILLLWSVSIIFLHLDYAGINIDINYFTYSYISLVCLIYILSFASFSNSEVFKVNLEKASIASRSLATQMEDASHFYSQRNGSEAKFDESLIKLNQKLIDSMEIEKYYLNPNLSLNELCFHLNSSRNELSLVINGYHQMNFYEFVNQYRVREVKRLMSIPKNENLTMESFGYLAGFNSKASFYRIFKEQTGKSPNQFYRTEKN